MLRLDHVQLAIPEGAEDLCRPFYAGLLGMQEVAKPPALAGRGGLWLERGSVRIHLGVEADFRPARKAHPAVTVADLDALARLLSEAGHKPAWDDAIPGVRRFYVEDPVGNRIEFMDG
jgi:catechol 2,3-dioxygenase-like lactoylglutathione lyase family enzyme